ncbi:MAG TPA: site-specific DNA-methyltransferase, partial [Fimbriimonas sp.]|nr:site-specific DNA-methyltransferase [Fimbriimonas sp.]
DHQIGLEPTLGEYIDQMVAVFEEVRRVLRKDGTCWLNLGDSFCSGSKWGGASGCKNSTSAAGGYDRSKKANPAGLKDKDLMGVPWRVAFALQDAGWYLRRDIIWSKKNPMPESVRDRPTTAHEYIFLLTKSPRYFYDAEAIREEAVATSPPGTLSGGKYGDCEGTHRTKAGLAKHAAKARESFRRENSKRGVAHFGQTMGTHRPDREDTFATGYRNARSVWEIPTHPFPGAHFAVFPEDIPRRCILAGCPVGGTVLDPFVGSGTTLAVAKGLGRNGIGLELNPEYAAMAMKRIRDAQAPLLEVA